MANSITLFKEYIALLDEVYREASTTSMLDGDSALVKQGASENEIVIPKMSLEGLADYSIGSGYVKGDISLTYKTVKFNYYRSYQLNVPDMDNEETAGIAFGKLSSEFIRTKVVPEMDAFRFATYAGTTGISKVSTGTTLATGADVISALRAATNALDENEVPAEDRILFITPTLHGMIQDMDTTKSREILTRFSQIILVPQTRFYTAIDLQDGTTAIGYKKAAGGADINFMVIYKPVLIQYIKQSVNPTNDDRLFDYHVYALADAYDDKQTGIYLHHKALVDEDSRYRRYK